MNKLGAYFHVICTPIRSWSDISAQHFPSLPPSELCFWRPESLSRGSLPPGELCFWRPESLSRGPKILYWLINMYQLKILSCPPAWWWCPRCLPYIYFYWKTVTAPRYYNGRFISRPNVEMNCNDIFMQHIFWSTWNAKVIAQSPAITAPQWEEMADCWGPMLRKNSLSWSLNRLQLSLYQQADGTRSKYN